MRLVQIGSFWINPAQVVAVIPAPPTGAVGAEARIVMTEGRFDVLNPPDDVAALLLGDDG